MTDASATSTDVQAPADRLAPGESICAGCARTRLTCCQTNEIYVTPGDVRRIAWHTGRSEFHGMRRPNDPSYLDQDDDPAWAQHVFRPDGTRRVLDRKANGDCTFLGDTGCTLPSNVRPLVCRLYPYEYDETDVHGAAEGCPVNLLRADQDLLQVLDMPRKKALAWHAQIYREIREELQPA